MLGPMPTFPIAPRPASVLAQREPPAAMRIAGPPKPAYVRITPRALPNPRQAQYPALDRSVVGAPVFGSAKPASLEDIRPVLRLAGLQELPYSSDSFDNDQSLPNMSLELDGEPIVDPPNVTLSAKSTPSKRNTPRS